MNLHDLCKSGTTESIEAYLQLVAADSPDDLGFLIDLRNDQRYTPLHCAIFARYDTICYFYYLTAGTILIISGPK
jgi:ankyrin repeat protein